MDADIFDYRIFAGTVRHSLDESHRVTIPARWRQEGDEEFYAVADPRKTVVLLMPPEELKRLRCGIEVLESLSADEKRAFTRQLFAGAFPCPVDKQGRTVLPLEICERFALKGEVVLAGTGTRIEVSDPGVWDDICAREREIFERGAEESGL